MNRLPVYSRGRCFLACGLLLAALFAGCRANAPLDMQETCKGEAARMQDGEVIQLWTDIFANESYRLSDGTEILEIHAPVWPWNAKVSGLEGFGGMSERAQQAVEAYYEREGLSYDVQALLTSAYADYRQCLSQAQDPKDSEFQSHFVQQECYPLGETARFTVFCSSLTQPRDARYNGTVTETRLAHIFDRETGEPISGFSLFSVPEAEVAAALYARCDGLDGLDISEEEFVRALRPEYILWMRSAPEIGFPPQVLKGFPDGLQLSVDFSQLADILQPWALPEPEAQ